jgi:hypothetical protein
LANEKVRLNDTIGRN